MMIKRQHWICGIITVPDGRVLTYRMVFPSGAAPWSAMLSTNCFGERDGVRTIRRLISEKYNFWPFVANVKHILSHNKSPALYYTHMDIDIDVYHIRCPEMVSFTLREGVETMAIPFETLMEDLGSGA